MDGVVVLFVEVLVALFDPPKRELVAGVVEEVLVLLFVFPKRPPLPPPNALPRPLLVVPVFAPELLVVFAPPPKRPPPVLGVEVFVFDAAPPPKRPPPVVFVCPAGLAPNRPPPLPNALPVFPVEPALFVLFAPPPNRPPPVFVLFELAAPPPNRPPEVAPVCPKALPVLAP